MSNIRIFFEYILLVTILFIFFYFFLDETFAFGKTLSTLFGTIVLLLVIALIAKIRRSARYAYMSIFSLVTILLAFLYFLITHPPTFKKDTLFYDPETKELLWEEVSDESVWVFMPGRYERIFNVKGVITLKYVEPLTETTLVDNLKTKSITFEYEFTNEFAIASYNLNLLDIASNPFDQGQLDGMYSTVNSKGLQMIACSHPPILSFSEINCPITIGAMVRE